jgi:hypothetical protein
MNQLLQEALRWLGSLTAIAYLAFGAWLCIAIARHEAIEPTLSKESRR